MKIQATLAVAAACVATTAAFTVGRRPGSALQRQLTTASTAGRTYSSSSSALRMSAEADYVKGEIASADVVVFSKTFCPFCRKTKNLLLDKGIDAKVIELDKVDNGDAIQDALLELSGQRTVPNVFIKGNHLGGNDDTQTAAREGKLEEMLA
mmetsp:Transcript_26670/g.62448  ORF Transcript_26670/g.62448 Transcript_26670/m.62448 type:complete len:152 (-) Transcript_26670:497-952(-)|eukprot:CAMPEP_0185816058 /NCGR_PEP_ID=MMETSP1322-20130828/16808_1 /TAXON_ID=265543 /ORGANISM="Minutocellus polymorphus, Strain RCC2270" /LENGTH=151 /DNA_ID=CAMNT_0028512981 /DNA_START=35 /DNA_END=490 /DNA_ORIENTATION=+